MTNFDRITSGREELVEALAEADRDGFLRALEFMECAVDEVHEIFSDEQYSYLKLLFALQHKKRKLLRPACERFYLELLEDEDE